MTPSAAIRSALTKYAVFSGRASRSEYWWFTLFFVTAAVIVLVLAIQELIPSQIGNLLVIALLALSVPMVAVRVRRLHDTGHSGWWCLIEWAPLGGIVLLVLLVRSGTPGPNRHGWASAPLSRRTEVASGWWRV